MSEDYGSDFIAITDEEGNEYALEVLSTLEYNNASYIAAILAGAVEPEDMQVSILKSVEEDGEMILYGIEDDQELETVYGLIMKDIYQSDDDSED